MMDVRRYGHRLGSLSFQEWWIDRSAASASFLVLVLLLYWSSKRCTHTAADTGRCARTRTHVNIHSLHVHMCTLTLPASRHMCTHVASIKAHVYTHVASIKAARCAPSDAIRTVTALWLCDRGVVWSCVHAHRVVRFSARRVDYNVTRCATFDSQYFNFACHIFVSLQLSFPHFPLCGVVSLQRVRFNGYASTVPSVHMETVEMKFKLTKLCKITMVGRPVASSTVEGTLPPLQYRAHTVDPITLYSNSCIRNIAPLSRWC